jgi:uncharacterized protein with HEPN domain
MKLEPALTARLEFLTRVTQKESQYLLDTDKRLFGQTFTIADSQRINTDPILAERLDAFVSRFGRLQDTVGDKLLPALLVALAENIGPAINNLDKAEKFGFIESVDTWMEMRKLRNQMVHEYIEDLAILTDALNNGHTLVPALVTAARNCMAEANRLLLAAH